jgi:CheY-like chemotaxis protein
MHESVEFAKEGSRDVCCAVIMGTVVSFPRMPGLPDKRHSADRRSRPRGGRRAGDKTGFAPLVLLVEENSENGARCEAILAKLRFAVAPAHTVDEALRVMEALRPNLVVARVQDTARLQDATPAGVPFLALTEQHNDLEEMVEEIRRALRAAARIR